MAKMREQIVAEWQRKQLLQKAKKTEVKKEDSKKVNHGKKQSRETT